MDKQDLLNTILGPDGPLASLWRLIESGSVELEVSQDNKLVGVVVSKGTVVVNICDMKRIREVMLVLAAMQKSGDGRKERKEQKKSKGKKDNKGRGEITDMLQDSAENLASMKKTLVLQYKGKDVLRAGYGAKSRTMGFLGYKNMEIVNFVLLMKLGKAFLLG